jgi:hypothetical protein
MFNAETQRKLDFFLKIDTLNLTFIILCVSVTLRFNRFSITNNLS